VGSVDHRSRRWPWLAAALALLLGGAWLMSRGERMPARQEVEVNMPRSMSPADRHRLSLRKRPPAFVVPRPAPDDPAPLPPPPQVRDPLLLAMPGTVKTVAIVVEANALRHSPVGELLLDCFMGAGEDNELSRLRSKTGLNVLEDLDRVAVADQTYLLSGRFADTQWAEVFPGMQAQSPSPNTRLWKGQDAAPPVVVWKNQIVIAGRSESEIMAAADRLEGRAPAIPPVIAENDSYGEVYGVVNSATIAGIFERDRPDLAARLKTITDQVKLHVDASHDVGIVADANGNDPAGALDLAKTLGGALALGRVAAQAKGNDDLAAFLDHASVRPSGSGSFRVELALPLDYVQAQLKDCPGRKPRPAGTK